MWADKQIELCVFSNCATHETFPLCAQAGIKTETYRLLYEHGALALFVTAYIHALQPEKPENPEKSEPVASNSPISVESNYEFSQS